MRKFTRLGKLDVREMREARDHPRGYVSPRFTTKTGKYTGRMCQYQWRTWTRLQDAGLTIIEGSGEADDMILTDEGKRMLAEYESTRGKERG